MSRSGNPGALEGALGEIESIAAEFSRAARGIVDSTLRRRVEAFFEARGEWFDSLRPEVAMALRERVDRAIGQGATDVEARLADASLWLSPEVVPGGMAPPVLGWSDWTPGWVADLLRRFSREPPAAELGELDDGGNRVWVALLSAARPLDPVLEEFELQPSEFPDAGGGHYGLQPKTAAQLDPSGTLQRLWKRYRLAYERYAALLRA